MLPVVLYSARVIYIFILTCLLANLFSSHEVDGDGDVSDASSQDSNDVDKSLHAVEITKSVPEISDAFNNLGYTLAAGKGLR